MDIRQILGMLQGVQGPNSSGEYTAKCPAHEDHTASLTLRQKVSNKDGKARIYLKDHAGCTTDQILAALGITTKDLIVDPDPDDAWKGKSRGRSASGRKASGRPARDPDQVEGRGADQPDAGAQTGEDEPGTDAPGDGGHVPTDVDVPPMAKDTVDGITVHTVSAAKPQRAGNGGKAGAGGVDKKDEPKIDWAHPDRVYSYTDADGKELFQVCRYQYEQDWKIQKTFRQRIYDPRNPKANKGGYVGSVPAEIRDTTLYRLPKVAEAVQAGRPVYVVEGEKDVETLERLGFTATCNPGGAGKWRDGYSMRLTGADVIILPDSDTKENGYTGQNHAYDVALKLQGIAKRVRLVDIKEACPDLPPKGDISDMVQILGDVGAMDALARQVAITRDFDPEQVPFWLTPMEQAERLYDAVKGYGVRDGCICQITGDTSKALCDFVVLPRMELTKDDGANVSLHFVLDGWNSRGRKLGRVTVKANELDGMNWVTEKWGFDASLTPGSTTKGKVAWSIKKVGQMTAKRVVEYNHTGWRKIGGKWCYLYHGGAVGLEGVTVDMGEALKAYRLDGCGNTEFNGISWKDAAACSLRILDVMRKDIGIALLGTMFLAPLREFFSQTDIAPAFALFLYGESGTHKTTAASLAMSHYGNFHAKNPVASFNDTGNMIRKKAFLVKDAPILVDDFHPTRSMQEKRQMSATAQGLSRAFGDGSDRGRLNADSTVKVATPPRSLAVITGEDLPDIGASGLARYFILDIDKGDIPVGKELTELQEKARQGYLQRSMRGYIVWLLKQVDGMPNRLHDLFLQYREMIRARSDGQHDRAPEAVACILIGYQLMLTYMRDIGMFDTATVGQMQEEAMEQLMGVSWKQARSMENEKPTRIFLDTLAELLSSKRIVLKDLTAVDVKEFSPAQTMAGYMDQNYYYLLPNVAFGAVQKLCREQGTEFPVSLRALYKHLRTDGIIGELVGSQDSAGTQVKKINGTCQRLLWIPRKDLNGPEPETVQTRMAMETVGNDELPEEWK